ncbi:biotin--[acetyl-CoA-carboxylase] ligase [Chloroflexota bacterium]
MVEDISQQSLSEGLTTNIIGRNIVYYPSVTSTMEAARQAVERGEGEGTVIIAGRQSAGRGRIGRTWLSPEGGVALSVILRPKMANLPHLTMLACLSVAYSIKAVTGLKTQIKWPNDVLINDKKVCGILTENDLRGNRVRNSIIGIGINVNISIKDYPEIAGIATSLAGETGDEVSRVDIISSLLAEMERLYLTLPDRAEEIFHAWRDSLITLGRNVTVQNGATTYEGMAESVDRDGTLMLRDKAGRLKRVVAADVTTG